MLTCEVSSLLGDYHFKLLLRKIQGQCKSDFGKIDFLALVLSIVLLVEMHFVKNWLQFFW